ncbi:MAG: DEAD/DEAH box helicase family protein [Promethearchaeota archaeon]
MYNFIQKNNGKIKIIIGVPRNQELNLLLMARNELAENFEEILKEDFLNQINLRSDLDEHYKLLAWLLYYNRIEIKFAIPVFSTEEKISELLFERILHEKIGILSDGQDYISFSGSSNMTYMAWSQNREEIKTFRSWDDTKKYAQLDFEKFQLYWDNKDSCLKVSSFPKGLKDYIISKYKPKDLNKINFSHFDHVFNEHIKTTSFYKLFEEFSKNSTWNFTEGLLIPNIEKDKPWEPQRDALDHLDKNKFIGFLAMATGTGKTKTSIFASYNLYLKLKKEGLKLITIIGVPDRYLVDQWYKELNRYSKYVIKCYHENPTWKKELRNHIDKILLLEQDHCYIVGTYKSLKPEILNREVINKKGLSKRSRVLFIADEAHSLGTPTGIFLMENFNPDYKIGLSATPQRHFDEEGTLKILDWFLNENRDLYELTLKDAQELGVVCKFEYKIFKCYFDDNDIKQYEDLSTQISKIRGIAREDYRTILLNQRADIIKKCKHKRKVLKSIILDLINKKEFEKCVIYCRDKEHITRDVRSVIMELYSQKQFKISFNLIDGNMDNKERQIYINNLANKDINTLIAMKCLDQGVDIPCLEKAIFMASSGSALEHIQRAGRILRKNKKKEEPVVIYDIIVLPNSNQMERHPRLAKNIIRIENQRITFFADYAENKHELMKELFDINNLLMKL